jgi:UDP-N-acetylmuramyl tripeptide synthase
LILQVAPHSERRIGARAAVANGVGKAVLGVRRLTRGGGSALPGLVAERIAPNMVGRLASQLPEGVIVVTGTNGKTTTTRMIVAILEAQGKKVLTNRSGSNLSRGVASALLERSAWRGGLQEDVAVFEVDEASMPAVCEQVRPSSVVVLNLFRDQLDRYGELDSTAAVIGRAIAGLDGSATVCLNADDPLVSSLSRYAERPEVRWYGVDADGVAKLDHDEASDSDHCPQCGHALSYDKAFYSHLGHYRCPDGHIERHPAEVELDVFKAVDDGASELVVNADGRRLDVHLPLPGLYNAYNAVAALCLARSRGLDLVDAAGALAHVTAPFGRVEDVDVQGRRLQLLLVKNPTGFNQIIQTFLAEDNGTRLMLVINDGFADGRDLSWLWDVAIEDIAPGAFVLCSGTRGADMALRFKYAGVDADVVVDVHEAIAELLRRTPAGEGAEVLANYTAMLELRAKLDGQADIKRFWQ